METKKSVLIAGTEFKVYDLDNKKYVEQVTTYPVTTTHKSYFTEQSGLSDHAKEPENRTLPD